MTITLDPGKGQTVVLGTGRVPNNVMLVGEAPGAEEARKGKPFVGQAGREQDRYVAMAGATCKTWYRTNVVKTYIPGNPDPTPSLIRQWTPILEDEISEVRPRVVVAVGRFATQWFLGSDVDMQVVHGLPHTSERAPGAVVVPTYHPAYGLYDTDARALVASDYVSAVDIIAKAVMGSPVPLVHDPYKGQEVYTDVGGWELAAMLDDHRPTLLGIDTEGIPSDPWAVQVSVEAGTGVVLRCARPDFGVGIRALQKVVDKGAVVVIHNAMYDIEMCRVMGLDLFDADLFDTMYASYLTRLEPQGLKALAYRQCGVVMQSYEDTVGRVGVEKQVEYLGRVIEREWPKPEPVAVVENDGTARVYTPQAIEKRAEKILIDLYAGKVDKDGNPVDPYKRWHAVASGARGDAQLEMRRRVEEVLGPMPIGELADLPIEEAVYYSARDADVTLRLYAPMANILRRSRLLELMETGMAVLPVFEEMQSTGMPARRDHFEALAEQMWEEMCRLQSRISHRYWRDRPFNPGSPKDVGALMRRRGLVSARRTQSGAPSTDKKAIEQYRYTDEAIAAVIDWRERQKILTTYCRPILERIPEGEELYAVRCRIKNTRTATRRIATADPNLVGIPVRNEIGRRVREGYQAQEGDVLAAWDLAQIEMRVAAHLSRDPLLVKLICEGRDIHAETAARIFGVKLADVDPIEHRHPAKRAAFGILYGIQGRSLLDQLQMMGITGWTVDRCDELIEEWLRVYEGVAEYAAACRAEVKREGFVRDVWGMIRYLPGIWADDPSVRAEAERIALSHKVQGGAQGMLQHSMVWLKPYIRALQMAGERVSWALQIHDEILLQFDEGLWETLNPLVMEALTVHNGIDLYVPVDAEGKMAKTWAGLK